jgi:hypothetical protein
MALMNHGHDKFHERSDNPYWSESAWFSFMIPERNLHGMLYMYYRPNMKLAAAGPFIWDLSGEQIYDCLYYGFDPYLEMPENVEMFDASLDNSYTVRTIEPDKAFTFGYKSKRCTLDFEFRAVMEPHIKQETVKDESQLHGWWSPVDVGHYDQVGRMTGSFTVDGERYDVDCYSMRDRSWGPRRLIPVRLAYPWAVVDDGHSFLAPAVSELPLDEDPVVGTQERIMAGAGWYMRDGIKSNLVSGTLDVIERGPDGRPLREVIDAVDELGRTLHAEGDTKNLLKLSIYGDWFDWYSLAEWEFDGKKAYGEIEDYHPFETYRRLQQSMKQQQILT